jgi:hypothetical protein
MSAVDSNWFARCEESIPTFLGRIKLDARPGRYLLCRRGSTQEGRDMSLAWSCFALKTAHMIGHWDILLREEREGWVEFIQDFQQTDEESAFEDPPEMAYLNRSPSVIASLLRIVGRGPWRPDPRSILLAETKQAIATLYEVGAKPSRPFRGFPRTPENVRAWLEAQDWTKPWGAGGQSAGLVVFLATQAPAFLEPAQVTELLDVCRDFFSGLVDRETGAYFRGTRPPHGELINGAMKVLMALDWLDMPIHYPDRLIATTLAAHPKRDGCHLVDAIYVLHRALGGRGAKEAVRNYCGDVFSVLQEHQQDGGGFSFYLRRAQTNYYGVPVSKGLDEPDIQGTCLLVWAAAMIWQLVDPGVARWKVLKP